MESAQEQIKAAGRVHFPMDADGYKILCTIGVSDHSVVYKAICESVNSALVAVKVIDIDRLGMDVDEFFAMDITSLSLVKHANILSPHCSFIVDRQLWIVMPYIRPGPLQSLVPARFPKGLPDQFLAVLLNELLCALVHLHELGYVHKDIKPSNIFIDSEGTVMLSDVNMSASVFKPKTASDDCSVPYWVAPEVAQSDDEYSSKSDVWSIGIVALEIAYGNPPISDWRAVRSQLLKISRRFAYNLNVGKMVSTSIIDRKLSNLLKDFVSSCLVKDPSERPSVASLLAHPFIKKGEGSNFLFRSIGKENVLIEDRFEKSKDRLVSLMKNDKIDDDDEEDSSQSGKILKISGWDFNKFLFELEPDEQSSGKRVRFGGIIPSKEEGSSSKAGELSKFKMPSLLKHVDSLRGRVGGSKEEEVEAMDNESIGNVLTWLLQSVDEQSEAIQTVFAQFGLSVERELAMKTEIENLKKELTAEKAKSFQLELDFELLKLQIPDPDPDDSS